MFKLSMRTIFTPDISPPGVAIRKSTMSSADEREIGIKMVWPAEDRIEDRTEDTASWCKMFYGEVCMFHCVLYQPQYPPDRSSSIGKL